MSPDIAIKLRNSIKGHEGFRKFPYTDTTGNVTIGYGRNLTEIGLSETEAEIFLNNDIVNATAELYKVLPLAKALDDVRKCVLIEMTFNEGAQKLLGFRDMIAALKVKDYTGAAKAMLDSKWAEEVGLRANQMALAMQTGEMQ